MKLLIVEPRAHGHHFSLYLVRILREAFKREWQVHLLTTQDALDHPAMKIISQEFSARVSCSLMPVPRQWMSGNIAVLLANQWFYRQAVVQGVRPLAMRQFDGVLLMDLDSVDKALALFGSPFGNLQVSGVFIHIKFHWPRTGRAGGGRFPRLGWRLFKLLLRRTFVHSVCVVDESFGPFMAQNPTLGGDKVRIAVEPAVAPVAIDRSVARKLLGVDGHEFIVLVYGAHTPRKGIHWLLNALDKVEHAGIRALVAGDMDRAVRALLESPQATALVSAGRLTVIDRFVGDEEERALFSAADLVWLGYGPEFDGQSGLLALAAAYGIPVLAKHTGMIGDTAAQHGLGVLIRPEQTDDVAATLVRLKENPGLLNPMRDRAAAFAHTRPLENFATVICSAIEMHVADPVERSGA